MLTNDLRARRHVGALLFTDSWRRWASLYSLAERSSARPALDGAVPPHLTKFRTAAADRVYTRLVRRANERHPLVEHSLSCGRDGLLDLGADIRQLFSELSGSSLTKPPLFKEKDLTLADPSAKVQTRPARRGQAVQ